MKSVVAYCMDLCIDELLCLQVPEFPVLAVLGYYGKVPGEVDQVCALGEEID